MLERLADDNVEVRRSAILSLGKIGKGTASVEEAVLRFVNDPDPETKLDAVVAAANLGKTDDAAIPTLVQAMGSKKESTAKAAGTALGEIGNTHPEKIVPSLVEILKNPDDPRALPAVKVLSRMKDQGAEALPYLAALYDKAPVHQRPQVLDALVTVDTKGDYAIPALIKTLDDPDPGNRREALIGLMRFRSEVPAIIEALTKALKDSQEENRVLAVGIIRGLGEQGAPALPALMYLASDPSPQVRSVAIGAIANLNKGSEEVLKMLETRVKDSELRVKMSAVQALRRLGLVYPDEAAAILRQALANEPDANAKRSIGAALNSIVPSSPPPDKYGGAPKPEAHPPQKTN